MACVVEEADRRGGTVADIAVREMHLRRCDGHLVAIVRACCYHWNWQEEAVAEAINREMHQ